MSAVCDLWTVACQAPLEFSRQEYWKTDILQGIFLTQGLNPGLLPLRHFRRFLYD